MKKGRNADWRKSCHKKKKQEKNNHVPADKDSMEIRSMPDFEKMREHENEARGLPKDFHRRLIKEA
ncbi:MAG: hypothetical protein PHE52_02540 [Candidatus Pacebacteria bacterium]|nr:hypothetical protein [Candidatus Paceibacterota bacterium]